jgi:hypothetical protein
MTGYIACGFTAEAPDVDETMSDYKDDERDENNDDTRNSGLEDY